MYSEHPPEMAWIKVSTRISDGDLQPEGWDCLSYPLKARSTGSLTSTFRVNTANTTVVVLVLYCLFSMLPLTSVAACDVFTVNAVLGRSVVKYVRHFRSFSTYIIHVAYLPYHTL